MSDDEAAADNPLAAMLGGQQGGGQAEADGAPADLGGLLSMLMGGGMPQGEPLDMGAGSQQDEPLSGAGPLSELLGGGVQAGPQAMPGAGGGAGMGGGPMLGGLLGALLGGGMGGSEGGGMPAPGGSGGGGLDALLGGGMSQQGSGLDGLLGAAAGGGADMGGGGLLGQLVAPFIQKLVGNFGLPPEIAQVVVVFVLNKLMGGLMGGGGAPSGLLAAAAPSADSGPLSGLLEQVASGQGVSLSFLRSSSLTTELVQQTGLDPRTATKSLQAVFGMLGEQMSA